MEEILYISTCNKWMRRADEYRKITPNLDIRNQIKWFLEVGIENSVFWQTSINHPARELDYITSEEWFMLN